MRCPPRLEERPSTMMPAMLRRCGCRPDRRHPLGQGVHVGAHQRPPLGGAAVSHDSSGGLGRCGAPVSAADGGGPGPGQGQYGRRHGTIDERGRLHAFLPLGDGRVTAGRGIPPGRRVGQRTGTGRRCRVGDRTSSCRVRGTAGWVAGCGPGFRHLGLRVLVGGLEGRSALDVAAILVCPSSRVDAVGQSSCDDGHTRYEGQVPADDRSRVTISMAWPGGAEPVGTSSAQGE
jgi:hypothetical protein